MELKVWCDGIQRVVCGVSAQTTCQEVVFALAHATGQTGRFILIEKFRNQSERLLAPNEHPLLVLTHWGEYAQDVQFVMKRSEGIAAKVHQNLATSPPQVPGSVSQVMHTSVNTSGSALVGSGAGSPNRRDLFNNSVNRKSGNFRPNSDKTSSTSPSMAKQVSSQAAPIAKNGNINSTTTPIAHQPIAHISAPALTHNQSTTSPVKQQQHSTPTINNTTNTNSISSHNLNTTNSNSNHNLNTNVIHMNNMNMNTNINHNNNNNITNNDMLTETQQTNHQKLIKNNNNINNSINNNNGDSMPSPKSKGTHRPRHPPPYSEAINKSALITSTGSTATTTANTSHGLEYDYSSSSDDRQQPPPTASSPVHSGTGSNNKRRSIEPSPQTQTKQKTGGVGGNGGTGTGSQKELLLHRDAIRLVDMQKETMRAQEKEMSAVEREIGSIEKKLLDNELLINGYKEEMDCLHQHWMEQEVLVDQFDGPSLELELDELVMKAQTYEEEVVTVKQKLSACEAQIGDCRQQITRLMDELEDRERQQKADNEVMAKEETDRLADQLMVALRDRKDDFESQKNDLQTLTDSIEQLDSALTDKTRQMERLLTELKEANLQGLSLQTGDEVSHNKFCTNGTARSQAFQHRSGSTRRIIGSPRELENAVATNKNPHGVWV